MPSSFWTRHSADVHTESTPKRPMPEPLELEDGPRSPCSFMPRHSYLMMMSPAVHPGGNKINNDEGSLVLDKDDSKSAQTRNDETEIFSGKVMGSDTAASSRNPTPTSEGFLKAETLIGEPGLLRRTLQFCFSYPPTSDIQFIGLVLVLLALLITAALMSLDQLLTFGLDLFALLISVLQTVSVTIEWGLEGLGFLLGRAIVKVMNGFLRGYHLG